MRELSVVVVVGPAYDVGPCLAALSAQTLPTDRFEVVVVRHRTGDAAPALGSPSPVDLEVVTSPSVAMSRAAARATGVHLARAPWVTFVDAGDAVSPDLLELLHDARHPDRVAVAGPLPADLPADASTDRLSPLAADSRLVAPERAPQLLRGRGGRLYPRAWLVGEPLSTDPEHASDAVLHGRLLSRFEHRFTLLDLSPAARGARYDAAPTASPEPADHVAALVALTQGTQAHPADRSALTDALVAAELADLRALAATPGVDRANVDRMLHDAGVLGVVGPTGPAGGHAPAPGTRTEGHALFFAPPAGPRSLVVVAGNAAAVNEQDRMLGLLARSGYGIRVLHYRGRLTKGLRRLPETHRVEVLPRSVARVEAAVGPTAARSRRLALRAVQESLRVGRRVLPEVVPARVAGPAYGRVDTHAARLLDGPGTHVVLDRAGRTLLRTWGDDRPAVGATELAALTLRVAASSLRGARPDAHAARRASRLLRADPDHARALVDPELWTMVTYRLQRAGRLEASAQLLADREAVFGPATTPRSPGLDALQALLTGSDAGAVDVVGAARSTLRAADEAFAAGDLDRAAFETTVALDLLFARRLHTAETRSPLVSEPDAFLDPLRESEIGRLLGHSTPPPPSRSTAATAPVAGRRRPRVSVLPGAYPKFSGAVVAELEGHADVEVLDLSARDKRFGNTGVDPATVRERLLTAAGHPPSVDLATAEALGADVVFVDWADKGLTWVTQVVPSGTRVVARLHGVDTLSAWLHTAQWEKVDDVIFPSDHLRRAAVATLGGRLDGVRQHVVANPVDVERYVLPKVASARTTLGLVGWAQQVKDPLWALEVLATLRRHDPVWRLRLVGADFAVDERNPVEREAAAAFRERMADPLVADGVDFVGYTTRLPEHLREVGWALSASRREGFHVGLVEMAASGAVPVVRDWPVYAGIGGAGTLFPPDWVTTTPGDAAERILRIDASGTWEDACGRTVDTVRARFSGTDSGERLRRIVLGES
ncbi:glycosyltransferase [Terrabacter aeriphilus]|uniref:glycosyltransferase n=1 Tax=Terrabacter aeriphilus TaxID=515662 RepID=UPI0031EA199D